MAVLPTVKVKVKVKVTLFNNPNLPIKPIKRTDRSPTRVMLMRFVHNPSQIGCDTMQTERFLTGITPWVTILLLHTQNRNMGEAIVSIPQRGIVINGKNPLSATELLPRTSTSRLQNTYSIFYKSWKEFGTLSLTGTKAESCCLVLMHSTTKASWLIRLRLTPTPAGRWKWVSGGTEVRREGAFCEGGSSAV